MAWIEVHQSLVNHKKTIILAELLDIQEVHAIGHLVSFWLWCLDNAKDGDLSGITPRMIARAAQWHGDEKLFLQAMIQAGFIDETSDGHVIHDWYDYAGRLIEKKKENAERMRASRAEKKRTKENSGDACNARATNVQRTCDERATHVQGLPTIPTNHTNQPKKEKHACMQNTLDTQELEGTADDPEPAADPAAEAREELGIGDGDLAVDEGAKLVSAMYERAFGTAIPPMPREKLLAYLDDGIEAEAVEYALRKAGEAGRDFRYADGIMRSWLQTGIRTLEQARREADEYKRRIAAQPRAAPGMSHGRAIVNEPDPTVEWAKEFLRQEAKAGGLDSS